MSNKPIKILRLDASAAKKASCKLRLQRIVIEGLKQKIQYNDTLYGSAFHLFIKTMYQTGGDLNKGYEAATKKFSEPCEIRKNKWHLNEEHLLKTCFDYWNHFRKKDDFETFSVGGKACVELDFDIPYYQEEDTDCIWEIRLTGTADGLGKFPRGCNAFRDYKTHSLWSMDSSPKGMDNAIKEFFADFDLSCQLMFYALCLKLEGERNPDSELGKILCQPIGSFIDGIFLSSKEATKFARSPIRIYRAQELKEYQEVVNGMVQQLVWLAKNPDYNNRDGILCGACVDGRFDCEFKNLCLQHYDPPIVKLIKEKQYITKTYNPLEFSK